MNLAIKLKQLKKNIFKNQIYTQVYPTVRLTLHSFEKNMLSIHFFATYLTKNVGMRSFRIFNRTTCLRDIDLPCLSNLTYDTIYAGNRFTLAPGVCWDIYKGYIRVQRFLLHPHNNCVYLVCIHLKSYNNMQMCE